MFQVISLFGLASVIDFSQAPFQLNASHTALSPSLCASMNSHFKVLPVVQNRRALSLPLPVFCRPYLSRSVPACYLLCCLYPLSGFLSLSGAFFFSADPAASCALYATATCRFRSNIRRS